MRHDSIFSHQQSRAQRDREIRLMPMARPSMWGILSASPRATLGGLLLGAVVVLLFLAMLVMA